MQNICILKVTVTVSANQTDIMLAKEILTQYFSKKLNL
jgi:hypothetical protein